MRHFDTGATRNTDEGKYDYEGFLSPLVLERFAAYMHKNRYQADGKIRDGDNWQKGIPKDAYIKSAFRHFMDWWKEHRGHRTQEGIEQALCAILFNVMGYLHETLKEKAVAEEAEKYRDEEARTAQEVHRGTSFARDDDLVLRTRLHPYPCILYPDEEILITPRYSEAFLGPSEEAREYNSGLPGDAGLEHG